MLKTPQTHARTRSLLLCLIALSCASTSFAATRHAPPKSAPHPGGLARTIAAILSDPAVARAHWGISVVTLDGTPVCAMNDQQYFQPASNAKLFTTAAALALLGPDFTMKTYVVAEGPISDGHLRGSLRLIGGGDPTLSGRAYPYIGHTERPNPPLQALDDLAAQVAASGIHTLDGTIVADDTLFAWERYGQGWAQDDLQWDYGAPVSALTVNDNIRYLTLTPGATAGEPATATWNPPLPDDSVTLKNEATTSPAGGQQHLGLDRQPDQTFLRAYGTIPAGGKPASFAIAVQDAAKFAGDGFAQSLAAHGVAVNSVAQVGHRLSGDTQIFEKESEQSLALKPLASGQQLPFSPAPEARIVAQRTSPPLSQIVTVVNKVSQNLHAEILLRLLGKAEGDDGSVAQGTRVVRQFLVSAGVQPDDFFFYDGSGLSPQDVITPRAATTLLAYAARQPWGSAYRASLPVGGIDGTLENRFTQPPLKGKVFAKTGTLAEVHALSGYLTAASGRTLVFSVLCNDHSPVTDTTRAAMDSVVAAIAAAN